MLCLTATGAGYPEGVGALTVVAKQATDAGIIRHLMKILV